MSDAETYPSPKHGWTCFFCGETMAVTQADHDRALRRAEEDGYARGLRDGYARGLRDSLISKRRAEK